MSIFRFIGDIHNYTDVYLDIINKAPGQTRQVGDFTKRNPTNLYDININKQIRGNHDDPAWFKQQSTYIPDGHLETVTDKNVMYIGGALSIDRGFRVEGKSWWPTEECSYEQFFEFHDKFLKIKPDVMVTHDCPEFVMDILLAHRRRAKYDDSSRTRNSFQFMWQSHKPKLWVFGHHHYNFDKVIMGTRFICIDICNYIDIDMAGDLQDGEIEQGY